jgi:hypothetical protein
MLNFDPEGSLNTIWDALHAYREDCIPEGDESYDRQWDAICTAMAEIREGLGLPSEVEIEWQLERMDEGATRAQAAAVLLAASTDA